MEEDIQMIYKEVPFVFWSRIPAELRMLTTRIYSSVQVPVICKCGYMLAADPEAVKFEMGHCFFPMISEMTVKRSTDPPEKKSGTLAACYCPKCGVKRTWFIVHEEHIPWTFLYEKEAQNEV